MRLLLVLCAVLGSALAQEKELREEPTPSPGTPGTFLVMAPKVIRPGRTLTASVSILDPNAGSVQVTATLLKNDLPAGTPASGSFSPGTDGVLDLVVPGDFTMRDSYKLKVEGTGGLTFTAEHSLTLNKKSSSVFVQTDKAKYKPGQQVKMRALAVDAELKTKKEPFDIDIFDPQDNKIVQWRGLPNVDGIVEKNFSLSEQPLLGGWKIKAMLPGGVEVEQPFDVEEYVLPKFEVSLNTQSYFAQTDDTLQGSMSAEYTYGKSVEGTGKVTLKLRNKNSDYRPTDSSIERSVALTDGSGTFQFARADIDRLFSSNLYYGSYEVELIGEVTEGLTGNTQDTTTLVDLVQTKHKLEFINTAENFKPGLQYTAYLKASYQDGTPMVGVDLSRAVTLTKTYRVEQVYSWNNPGRTQAPDIPTETEMLTIPESGVMKIVMDVPSTAESMDLSATYNDISATAQTHTVRKAESPSNSYIQVTTSTPEVAAGQDAQFTVKSTAPIGYFSYQILSRGNIVASDRVAVSPVGTEKSFTIPTNPQMAPTSRIVAFWMTDTGEICNDGLTFTVTGAFENQVSLGFDRDRAEPAEDIALTVRADPGSLVAVLTVDESVRLMATGNDITQDKVYEELELYDSAEDRSNPGPQPFWRRRKRSIWWPMPTSGDDAYSIFENAGVIVMTDATVHRGQPDYFDGPFFAMDDEMDGDMAFIPEMAASGGVGAGVGGGGGGLQEVTRVRSFFPETWLWKQTTTGPDGTARFDSTVPDTITSWVASAFALNDISGLGVTETPASMEAFRPFFVSLNLPYSVVAKEQTAVQALVFNYMDVDMDVTVTLEGSEGFKSLVTDTNDVTQVGTEVDGDRAVVLTVPAGSSRSKSFPIVPKKFGSVPIKVRAQSTLAADAVERPLLVDPEGEEKDFSKSYILDLSDGDKTLDLSLALPTEEQGLVAGSARAVVSVMGDMMGSTISGLDSLLRMPTGCGEQTMISFAPNVYVNHYLVATNQRTQEIEDKALEFMTKGYQRELTYFHDDGSVSAFGENDPSGSMWLTGFVVKCFVQSTPYIYIDPAVLAKAVRWMINRQQSSGVFPEPGRVIHTEMQGGVSSEETMTANILISLMEYTNAANISDKVDVTTARNKAVNYLEQRLDSVDDVYTIVLMTYALTLADSSRKDEAFTKMNAKATTDGGQMFWTKTQTTPTPVSDGMARYSRSSSSDVEMTAYALLTYLARDETVQGMPIMKWLTEQQSAYGGYSSTQDTVVGLQGLGFFAAEVYSSGMDMTVTVTSDSDSTLSHVFTVNQGNALVLQQLEIPNVSGTLTAVASGTGMGLLQLLVQYNVVVEDNIPAYGLTTQIQSSDTNSVTCKTCAKYNLGGTSGMAVVEFGIPSGFFVEDEDLKALVADTRLPTLKRAERSTDNKKAVLYFDEMGATDTCVTLTSKRSMPVAKTQPSVVKVFDYYKPELKASTFYQSDNLKNTNICDVCDDCNGCVNTRGGRTSGGRALAVDTLLGALLMLLTRVLIH